MERYANRGGDSGVTAFEKDADSITVQFKDGSLYLYNGMRPGFQIVDRMKTLALSGQGLNSYISTTVKKNFFKKLR